MGRKATKVKTPAEKAAALVKANERIAALKKNPYMDFEGRVQTALNALRNLSKGAGRTTKPTPAQIETVEELLTEGTDTCITALKYLAQGKGAVSTAEKFSF